jgi:hypothetical protein
VGLSCSWGCSPSRAAAKPRLNFLYARIAQAGLLLYPQALEALFELRRGLAVDKKQESRESCRSDEQSALPPAPDRCRKPYCFPMAFDHS